MSVSWNHSIELKIFFDAVVSIVEEDLLALQNVGFCDHLVLFLDVFDVAL